MIRHAQVLHRLQIAGVLLHQPAVSAQQIVYGALVLWIEEKDWSAH
jgi:hypothetical protein